MTDWDSFLTPDGMLSTERHPDYNEVGTTAMAVALGDFDDPIISGLRSQLQKCFRDGKLYEFPESGNLCKRDDYTYAAAASTIIAGKILYGNLPLKYFYWKFTGFWTTCKYTYECRPSWYHRKVFIFGAYLCRKSAFKVQDSYLQTGLSFHSYEQSGCATEDVSDSFETWKKHLKDNGYTLKRILIEFTNEPTHPLAELFGRLDRAWGLV